MDSILQCLASLLVLVVMKRLIQMSNCYLERHSILEQESLKDIQLPEESLEHSFMDNADDTLVNNVSETAEIQMSLVNETFITKDIMELLQETLVNDTFISEDTRKLLRETLSEDRKDATLDSLESNDSFMMDNSEKISLESVAQDEVSIQTDIYQHSFMNDTLKENQVPFIANKKTKSIIQELIHTEETYVRQLQELIDLYYIPLTQILNQKYLMAIFSNIRYIHQVHSRFLKQLSHQSDNIAAVFLEFIPSFIIYSTYCNNFGHALNTLKNLRQGTHGTLGRLSKSSAVRLAFTEFCQQVTQDARHSQISLDAYLLLVIQRLPRYELLLKQLSDEEEEEFSLCFLKLKQLNEFCNHRL